MKKFILLQITFITLFTSCVSTKLTIKNIDDKAQKPAIVDNHFVIKEYSKDEKYGYDKDYPINIGFNKESEGPKNIQLFFNAILGEKNEKFTFSKIESCCPFPTKKTNLGAGTLDIYEIVFENSRRKVKLYFNLYEKGAILCPNGFVIKKSN